VTPEKKEKMKKIQLRPQQKRRKRRTTRAILPRTKTKRAN